MFAGIFDFGFGLTEAGTPPCAAEGFGALAGEADAEGIMIISMPAATLTGRTLTRTPRCLSCFSKLIMRVRIGGYLEGTQWTPTAPAEA